MSDIRVVCANMPVSVKGYTIRDADGFYTIVLNSNHSHDQNRRSYLHEIFHIENGDFDRKGNVGMIELFAHQNK